MTKSKQQIEGGKLLQAVQAVAMDPEEAHQLVEKYEKQLRAANPSITSQECSARVADKVTKRYAKLSGLAGGASALPATVPGVGTAVGSTVGAAGDVVACMKFQVDMTMCMAAAYGYDLSDEDARHMSFLIAAGGAVEKAGAEGTARIASKAGVKLVKQHLKGATLQAVKAAFRKVGITFTRKALEKAIPFGVGVVVGSTFNYGLTRYVGAQARDWFVIDAEVAS
jgi:hypothetical protein